MKITDKPREIRIVKRKKGEKVKIYHCDGLKIIDDKVYAINCQKDLLIIGEQEEYNECEKVGKKIIEDSHRVR